jgi:integrase
MAEVNQRAWKVPGQRAKRKAWGFTVQVDGKQKRVYKSEWTKDDAEKALAAFVLEVEPPEPAKPTSGMTLAQAAERYLATKARKRTLKKDERILKHLKSAFGADTPLADLTASRISEYKATRLATKLGKPESERLLTAAAVNRPLALLRHLVRIAHEEWEVLPAVPKIRLEKEPQGRLRWLTEDEIKKLLEACGKSRNRDLRAAVTVALNTGLRRSELLGLTWDRADLSRGVIRLEVTKSGKRREVPLNGESYAALVSLGPKEAGRVFRKQSLRKAYENAVTNAKLDDVNFHTLRHTFASWAVMRGVSLKELQELLGHSSLAMTMRYAHLAPERLRSAVTRLEGLTSSKPAAEQINASVNA